MKKKDNNKIPYAFVNTDLHTNERFIWFGMPHLSQEEFRKLKGKSDSNSSLLYIIGIITIVAIVIALIARVDLSAIVAIVFVSGLMLLSYFLSPGLVFLRYLNQKAEQSSTEHEKMRYAISNVRVFYIKPGTQSVKSVFFHKISAIKVAKTSNPETRTIIFDSNPPFQFDHIELEEAKKIVPLIKDYLKKFKLDNL